MSSVNIGNKLISIGIIKRDSLDEENRISKTESIGSDYLKRMKRGNQ